MSIDVKIFAQSVAALDADLIDLDDKEELEDSIYVTASSLCKNPNLNNQEIVSALKQSIAGSDKNEFALLLIKTTNVDWLYDDETIKLFQLVTEKLLAGVEYYSNND